MLAIVTLLTLLCFSHTFADPPLKVICAGRAKVSPKIDGLLDDACWGETEARDDFSSPTGAKSLKRRTVIRVVYDDENLYLGLEFFWNDIQILKKAIRTILEEKGKPAEGVTISIDDYVNRYGVEIFIDPGATKVNWTQILFNAAGQYAGNYKMMWDRFKGGNTFRSVVHEDRWTAELVQPAKGLKPGDAWGFNLVRNDESYYGMWKQFGGAFAQPKKFGRLVIGSYSEWWEAVFAKGTQERLEEIRRNGKKSKRLLSLNGIVAEHAAKVGEIAEAHPPSNRNNFELLYRTYTEFKKNLDRLEVAYETYRQMNK